MIAYTSHNVAANSINIHYYRTTPAAGGRRQAIVLLHGLTDNGLCWLPVADVLGQAYDVIMPDTRGHGLSDKPADGYSVEERAADVAGLIDALALDRPVLMGHSLGGQVAMAIAALYPDKVRGIILEDPAWFVQESTPEQQAAQARGWQEGLLRDKNLTREALIERCRQQNPLWHADEFGPWADSKQQMSADALVKILTSMHGSGWRAFVRQAECPILLLRAEPERGAIITTEMVQEAAGLWKNGRDALIAGAGHCIHRDQFEAVMQVVKNFLAKLF